MLSQPLGKVSAVWGVLLSENLCIAEVSKEWHPLFKGGNCSLVSNYRVCLPDVLFVGSELSFCTLIFQYLKGYLLPGMWWEGSDVGILEDSIVLK